MSLHSVGSDTKYILPASQDEVPEAFRSNRSAKPIPMVLQTVNIPSLSGSQSLGGSSIIQVPCGASAGLMMNPYLRFSVQLTGASVAGQWTFKGGAAAASAALNRVSTYLNSVQIDNIQSCWSVYDNLFLHSTSNDYMTHDAKIMFNAGVAVTQAAAGNTAVLTFCLPLIGLLGSQQALPLYLINGTLQLQCDWQSIINNIYQVPTGQTDPVFTGASFTNVQLVFDKLMPEQAFVDKVRSDMMQGHKYVMGYTNYATTFITNVAGTPQTLNYGLNVSSLRGVVAYQYNQANLSTSALAIPIANNMRSFQLNVDGRLINTVVLDSVATPSLCFAELQRCFGRIFDASITDVSDNATYTTASFATGVSCQRINEGLAFSGSPCSIASVQTTSDAVGGVTTSMYFLFISDFQLLIDASGSVEIIR